jgi:hypothetical protein
MWSHYSAGHKGVCLCFSTRQLFRGFGIDRGLLIPIVYQPACAPFRTIGWDCAPICSVLGRNRQIGRMSAKCRVVLPGETGNHGFPKKRWSALL